MRAGLFYLLSHEMYRFNP